MATSAQRPASHAGLVPPDERVCQALGGEGWIAVGVADAHFSPQSWLYAMEQLILHPEHTSTSILRADVLDDNDENGTRTIRRRLLPRRPNLDKSLDQLCHINAGQGLVTMHPILSQDDEEIPYYHPRLKSLAFRYTARESDIASSKAQLEMYVVPLACDRAFDAAKQPQHRLSRTILALLELQVKIAWGCENGYRKRVTHDVVVPRDAYQELYLRLRQKYARTLIERWLESTDPRKHVFEDIGIAAFVMLLWHDMFPDTLNGEWGRPTVFVDVGCGNGLLVYLLNAEGYAGYGVDVQERKSWSLYRALHPATDLRAEAVLAPDICNGRAPSMPEGAFLIGNHADELTAWIPFLAHHTPKCTGFINIPCCRFALDGTNFGNSKYAIDEEDVRSLVGTEERYAVAMEQIGRGPAAESDTRSRNVAYLRYLSHLHLQAGWSLEKEALRIPSTKNWTLVGRRRTWEDVTKGDSQCPTPDQVRARVDAILSHNDGGWQARGTTQKGSNTSH